MKVITSTELARNVRHILDRILLQGEEVAIERNHVQIARLVPGPGRQTAREAMGDLFGVLDDRAGESWLEDSRDTNLSEKLRDPWAS